MRWLRWPPSLNYLQVLQLSSVLGTLQCRSKQQHDRDNKAGHHSASPMHPHHMFHLLFTQCFYKHTQCVERYAHRMWSNRRITQKTALTLLPALREDVSFSSLAVFLIFLSSPTPFLHFSPKTNGPSPLYVLFPPSFQTHTVPVKLISFSQSCTSTL